jgi:hypothetical protein
MAEGEAMTKYPRKGDHRKVKNSKACQICGDTVSPKVYQDIEWDYMRGYDDVILICRDNHNHLEAREMYRKAWIQRLFGTRP